MDRTCTTVIGVFDTRQRAERAVLELRAAGLRAIQLGMLSPFRTGDPAGTLTSEEIAEPGTLIGDALSNDLLKTYPSSDMAGALVGLGISETDAIYCEGEAVAGRFLVAVDCSEGRSGEARSLIGRNCGYGRIPPHMR